MDLESLKEKALGGDVEACMTLGDLEMEEQTDRYLHVKNARGWYEIAAKKDEKDAVKMMLQTNLDLAVLTIGVCDVESGGYDTVPREYLEQVMEWGEHLKKLVKWKLNLREYEKFAKDTMVTAQYFQAVCLYMATIYDGMPDSGRVMKKLEGLPKDRRFMVLQGLAQARELMTNKKNQAELENAANKLKDLMGTVTKPNYHTMLQLGAEQEMAALAALYLSTNERIVFGSDRKAYKILESTRNCVTYDKAISRLEMEMAKFKKSFLKGYEYME